MASNGAVNQLKAYDKSISRRLEEPASPPQLAGTGMGDRESHPTINVEFHYDTGMYSLASAVVIYYDFARPTPMPNPFPEPGYAPEM